MAAALPGWRWRREGFEVTVFAGLDVQDHRFSPDDPGNRLRGTHGGARGGFDVWYEPFRDGMVTASASLSTVGSSYWTRAAAGWRFFDASGSARSSMPAATTPIASSASARTSQACACWATNGPRAPAG